MTAGDGGAGGGPPRAAPSGPPAAGAGAPAATPPRPRPVGVPGGTIASSVGSSFETMKKVPFVGLIAELPQLAPPLWPGISIDPCMLGGVNTPSFRHFPRFARNPACSSAVRYGLTSFSVNDCPSNGEGRVG